MKIIVKDKAVKTNNFITYLVENCTKENKTYEYELVIDDKFDKRFVNEKEIALNNKVLVMHSDGFDVFENEILTEYDKFKEAIEKLIDSKDFAEFYSLEKFKKHFMHFVISVKDTEIKQSFSFVLTKSCDVLVFGNFANMLSPQ